MLLAWCIVTNLIAFPLTGSSLGEIQNIANYRLDPLSRTVGHDQIALNDKLYFEVGVSAGGFIAWSSPEEAARQRGDWVILCASVC